MSLEFSVWVLWLLQVDFYIDRVYPTLRYLVLMVLLSRRDMRFLIHLSQIHEKIPSRILELMVSNLFSSHISFLISLLSFYNVRVVSLSLVLVGLLSGYAGDTDTTSIRRDGEIR